jgi:hypothetical protein
MLEDYKQRSISPKEAAKLSDEELEDRIVVGELADMEKREMLEEVKKMKNKTRGGVE